jgi:hypothetical protein
MSAAAVPTSRSSPDTPPSREPQRDARALAALPLEEPPLSATTDIFIGKQLNGFQRYDKKYLFASRMSQQRVQHVLYLCHPVLPVVGLFLLEKQDVLQA